MAKLPALIIALSDNDPRGYGTVRNYARIIREAGLIPTTKRGSGASEMTEVEAANLILAMAEVGNANKAPDAVRMLRGALIMGPRRGEASVLDQLDGYALAEKAGSLGEFLEEVLRTLSSGHGYFLSSVGKEALFLTELRLTSPDSFGCDAYFSFDVGTSGSFVVQFHGASESMQQFLSETPRQKLGERLPAFAKSMAGAKKPTRFEVKLSGDGVEHVAKSLVGAPKKERAQAEEARDEI